MTVRRVARLVRWTVLLAAAGVAIGFAGALVRPRPKSGYAAADRQPVAPKGAKRARAV